MDPFNTNNQTKAQNINNAAGSLQDLFDEDNILGVIATNAPVAAAAAVQMSQQEAIFGQKQLTGRPSNPYGGQGGALPTDIFAGIGGAPQEEEKKESFSISENHYQDTVN